MKMQQRLFKWFSFVLAAVLVSGLFLSVYPSSAQANLIAPSADSDDDFPLYIDITGTVTALSPTSITVDNLVITLPAGLSLPAGVTIGATITIHARITDDDVVIAITVVIGAATATPTPAITLVPSATPIFTPTPETTLIATGTITATPAGTLTATPAGTITATPFITGTPPVIKGCGLPKAVLALYIAQAYNIPLDELEFWHCNGHAYGVIAKAYAIVFGQSGNATVPTILDMHKKGKKWSVIITDTGSKPDQSPIKVNGGKASGKDCPPGQAKKGNCGPAANGSEKGNGKDNKPPKKGK